MQEMNEKELRELDAWVAEHVMGWKIHTSGRGSIVATRDLNGPDEREYIISTTHPWENLEFSPTTDPAAAMQVLERCVNELCEQDNEETVSVGMEVPYFVVEKTNNHNSLRVEADTLPLAISLFAKQLFSKPVG